MLSERGLGPGGEVLSHLGERMFSKRSDVTGNVRKKGSMHFLRERDGAGLCALGKVSAI